MPKLVQNAQELRQCALLLIFLLVATVPGRVMSLLTTDTVISDLQHIISSLNGSLSCDTANQLRQQLEVIGASLVHQSATERSSSQLAAQKIKDLQQLLKAEVRKCVQQQQLSDAELSNNQITYERKLAAQSELLARATDTYSHACQQHINVLETAKRQSLAQSHKIHVENERLSQLCSENVTACASQKHQQHRQIEIMSRQHQAQIATLQKQHADDLVTASRIAHANLQRQSQHDHAQLDQTNQGHAHALEMQATSHKFALQKQVLVQDRAVNAAVDAAKAAQYREKQAAGIVLAVVETKCSATAKELASRRRYISQRLTPQAKAILKLTKEVPLGSLKRLVNLDNLGRMKPGPVVTATAPAASDSVYRNNRVVIKGGVATAAQKISLTTAMNVDVMQDIIALKVATLIACRKLSVNLELASAVLTTGQSPFKPPCDTTLRRYMRYLAKVFRRHDSGVWF